jgi:hypothetical protein
MMANRPIHQEGSSVRPAIAFICDNGEIEVPGWIDDLASFRRWLATGDIPDVARVWWLAGELLVDMSREPVETHRAVRDAIDARLGGLIRAEGWGRYFPGGALLVNAVADIVGEPDAVFLHVGEKQAGMVRVSENPKSGAVIVEGSPALVLEVVSDSSAEKDTAFLRRAYFTAGVYEYWLVDARGDAPSLDILQPTRRGFRAARKRDGWVKSYIFLRYFKLTRQTDRRNHSPIRLEVRKGAQ